AVRLLVPFGRQGDELAIAVAAGHIGEHDGGQVAGAVQLAVPALDLAVVSHLAQHGLQNVTIATLDAERARDLALAHLAFTRADECQDIFLGGKGIWLALLLGQMRSVGGRSGWRNAAYIGSNAEMPTFCRTKNCRY